MIERLLEPQVYAVWSKNTDTRFKSTSGGAFTEIAKTIICDGGYVAGAKYNKNNLVVYSLVSDLGGLEELR